MALIHLITHTPQWEKRTWMSMLCAGCVMLEKPSSVHTYQADRESSSDSAFRSLLVPEQVCEGRMMNDPHSSPVQPGSFPCSCHPDSPSSHSGSMEDCYRAIEFEHDNTNPRMILLVASKRDAMRLP